MASAPASLPIENGICRVVFAFDVGRQAELDACDRLLHEGTVRTKFRRHHRVPEYFDYTPPPLRVVRKAPPIRIASTATSEDIELTIYDFGAITVGYRILLQGALSDLIPLATELYENEELRTNARAHVDDLRTAVAAAIHEPRLSDEVEDYVIFDLGAPAGTSITEAIEQNALELAQILRAEDEHLSQQEISDALSVRISYTPRDAALIDWNAALLIGGQMEDVTAVLEFATVELLEMRFLDAQLDATLDDAYDALTRRKRYRTDLHRIGQLQVDATIMFEGVENSLKLLGDQYLARVYTFASQRFHLPEWVESIHRKLEVIDSIYGKIEDRSSAQRMEVLEWIIIVLIAVSIILGLK